MSAVLLLRASAARWDSAPYQLRQGVFSERAVFLQSITAAKRRPRVLARSSLKPNSSITTS
jgi:hypothetical protein